MRIVLHFPDEAVGYLWHDAPAGETLAPIGPAQGEVAIDVSARLHVEITNPAGLPCFVPLGPNGVTSMYLGKTAVRDADLLPLQHLEGLTYLRPSEARALGDAGLAHLRGLRRLEELDLYATRVSDAGLQHLSALTRLQRLHLGATRVRGSGLHWLAALRSLRRLSLEGRRVEDATLPPLGELTLLTELVLRETLVTRHGAERLGAMLPSCRVHGNWEQNEAALARARRRRVALTVLVHRIVPKHPVAVDTSEEELLEVARRLLPTGTLLQAYDARGRAMASVRAPVDWDERDEPDDRIHCFLSDVPAHGYVGITLPGGSRYTVPWMVARGPDRRPGRPRVVDRLAN